MIRLLWALSAHARYYLRRYMPTNIALDAIRTRRGLKWGILAMLLAVPYFLAANYCITLIEGGGPGFGQRQTHGVGIVGQHGFGHGGCFNINSCRRLMGGRCRPIWLEIARARRHLASSGTSRGCAFMAASSASLYCC